MADEAQPVTVQIPGLEKLVARMGDQVFREAVKTRMEEALRKVEAQARMNAPVDTGHLRRSITHEVRELSAELQGVTGSPVEYAPVMEFGRRPGQRMPPPSALAVWCARHGMPGAEFVVARAIAAHGIEGRRYLTQAWESRLDEVREIMIKSLDDVAAQLAAAAGG